MNHTFGGTSHIRPSLIHRQRLFDRTENQVATHPGREVEDNVRL